MPINKNDITSEMIQKALQCNTAEDLIAFAIISFVISFLLIGIVGSSLDVKF